MKQLFNHEHEMAASLREFFRRSANLITILARSGGQRSTWPTECNQKRSTFRWKEVAPVVESRVDLRGKLSGPFGEGQNQADKAQFIAL